MSCDHTPTCTCGCCSGIGIDTPRIALNPPGQPAVAYRTGTWGTFRESMLARLSSTDYPALAHLRTRATDDFSIALLDASAVVFDILAFYQERLVNESYLRTATQPRSIVELARLTGYQPAPGVAAQTYLAFTLKAASGLPATPSLAAVTIPAGTQVQSVPAQGQSPQSFETAADILAKPDWNALPVTAAVPWVAPRDSGLTLAGTATHLGPGDALLILGAERESWSPGSTPDEQWDIVVLDEVRVDTSRLVTWVGWNTRLRHASGGGASPPPSAWTSAKVFALRQRAALFGSAAPDPRLFVDARHTDKTSLPGLVDTTKTPWVWKGYALNSGGPIDLDTTYPKVSAGSWFALVAGGGAQLYKVAGASAISRTDFGLTSRVTELVADYVDTTLPTAFPLQGTAVLTQSEALAVARQPLDHPLYGTVIDIDALRPDLVGVQAVALLGKAQKVQFVQPPGATAFVPDDGSGPLVLHPGDTFTLIDPGPLPVDPDGSVSGWATTAGPLALRVADAGGRTGTIEAPLASFALAPSAKDDADIQEYALLAAVQSTASPYPHMRLLLREPLANVYERGTTAVNANVGLATAGRTVGALLGSGSASTPNQRFALKQAPLTYVQASTPNGRLSTLKVVVDGVAWKEVPTLYDQPSGAAVYATRMRADGTAETIFGDGLEGAMLPGGQNNVQATYRVGSGMAGNVGAGALTTLVDRPLGVGGVTNPQAATGGQDAQSSADTRANAPLAVLTLGRAVSVADYQAFAAGFAGIAKASALWIPSGPARGVFLTVAGAGGVALPPGDPTLAKLVTSLGTYGSSRVAVHVASFVETLFRIAAAVAFDPDRDAGVVSAAIVQTLRTQYGFAARGFGQGVSVDEVAALIQGVPGVVGVNVLSLVVGASSLAGDLASSGWTLHAFQQWVTKQVTVDRPSAGQTGRICPYIPVATSGALPLPAEVLVLDPDPKAINLSVLS